MGPTQANGAYVGGVGVGIVGIGSGVTGGLTEGKADLVGTGVVVGLNVGNAVCDGTQSTNMNISGGVS
jgi:hypothetical protein